LTVGNPKTFDDNSCKFYFTYILLQKMTNPVEYYDAKPDQRPQDTFLYFYENRLSVNLNKFKAINPLSKRAKNWTIRDEFFSPTNIDEVREPTFVDSKAKFEEMMTILEKESEIAVFTHSNERHSYHGMICYITITTPKESYIIFVPSTIVLIKSELKTILESENIIKIIYDAANVVHNIQKDYKIFPLACID